MTAPLIILAAGGTGGHVFPADALASELTARGYRLALITDRRGGAYGGALGSLETHHIRAGGIAGKGLTKRLESIVELGLGTLQARRLLTRLGAKVAIGFGGYASVPTMMAATWLGLKTGLHEQNAVLGRANRLLAPKVKAIATSFPETQSLPPQTAERVQFTGMPVREEFIKASEQSYPPLKDDAPIRLLVTGGSQGARVLSQVVPAAIAALEDGLRKRLSVTQQCREEDLVQVQETYDRAGVTANLASFLDQMPERLAEAHLLIGRAGASTVSEALVVGRPAILVPYPHAVDDHQDRNAHAVDEAGAGWLMAEDVFTSDRLADRLSSLLSMPVLLERAADAAKQAGRPDAAANLADMVEGLITSNGRNGDHGRQAA